MGKSGKGSMAAGPEESLIPLLREYGDAVESGCPPFDTAAHAGLLRAEARAIGFLRSEDPSAGDLAAAGVGLEEQAPSFDVEAGAARLRGVASARGLLSSVPGSEGDTDLLRESGQGGTEADSQPDPLLRMFVPSEGLHAEEQRRLLALFSDWLTTTRGQGVRQAGYHTASGDVYEFFVDASGPSADIRGELDIFSSFLALCSADPSAAAGMLAPIGLGDAGADFTARLGREVRRLEMDLRHERERRMLEIRHSLEMDLVNLGVELRGEQSAQIHALVERVAPEPSVSDRLAPLAAPQSAHTEPQAWLNIKQQAVNAIEAAVVHGVQGTIHVSPKARELLGFIERFGGGDGPSLRAAVYDLEDPDTPLTVRSVAKLRLKELLNKIPSTVDLLDNYLESKMDAY